MSHQMTISSEHGTAEHVTTSTEAEELLAEVKHLRIINQQLEDKAATALVLFKETLEGYKLDGYHLNQDYIDGVDKTLDRAIEIAEEIFGEETHE